MMILTLLHVNITNELELSLFLTSKTLKSIFKGLLGKAEVKGQREDYANRCRHVAVCTSLLIKDSVQHIIKDSRFTAVQLNNKSATATSCTLDLLLSWSYDYFIDCVFILI